MPLKLNITDNRFSDLFSEFLFAKREAAIDVESQVSKILQQVRLRGDEAVIEYTNQFDRVTCKAEDFRISASELFQATDFLPEEQIRALHHARDRITAYHSRQMPSDDRYFDKVGNQLGHRWTAVASVGLYVPGGLASYPSSLLMNAIPAKVAGVPRIAMVVPAPNGQLNPLVLAAAKIVGVDEIYRIGGAQAIGALTFGTSTIPPVDKIVGPGNVYVAAAKRKVFGAVGIEMIAGPSELLILADSKNRPDWVAADLLSQAEHDTAAQSILITDNEAFAEQVMVSVAEQLSQLPKADIASESWDKFGCVITVQDWDEAVELVDLIAPEHLAISLADDEILLSKIRNAGSIFLGAYTPEPIGDYIAGPNHVLPTARGARFASGLSVLDFMKRSSIIRCSEGGLAQLGPDAIVLAEAEGLSAHARAVSIRLQKQR